MLHPTKVESTVATAIHAGGRCSVCKTYHEPIHRVNGLLYCLYCIPDRWWKEPKAAKAVQHG